MTRASGSLAAVCDCGALRHGDDDPLCGGQCRVEAPPDSDIRDAMEDGWSYSLPSAYTAPPPSRRGWVARLWDAISRVRW
ncbi:MAG: hypothetical protein IT340_20170 [Chloroflexi bacterium]|nr:hypothetical protein [Chloroflexota bacterium]